jgi:hypothetical protein
MHNIRKENIDILKSSTDKLYNLYNEADAWVLNNLKFEEKDTTAYKVKNGRRIVRKIAKSLDSKPVFALFGASQVGKSYLIKNLLSISGAPLKISLNGQEYDFLKEINPPGVGAESTGVVTRFTIDNVAKNNNFPIRIKLLDAKDLIIILCDSYFSDTSKIENYTSIEDFNQLATALTEKYKDNSVGGGHLIQDDILDVKEYFSKYFYKNLNIINNIEKSNYWLSIANIIDRIPADDWHQVFSVLWNNNPHMTTVFKLLVEELKLVNFSSVVFAPKEAVLRGHGEILDVQRLKELISEQKSITVQSTENEQINLHLSRLSALSSELTLIIPASTAATKPFLNNTDLLDFPGARSRLELNVETISENSVPDMFLRGKVAYLFNKYSADYEINNLLFCQNDKQLDVNEIPSLLNDWISNNIGHNKEDRERRISNLPISPLFIIFTFFNNQLKYDSTNDDKDNVDYKWDNRFVRFFEKEVVTSNNNWHNSWSESSPIFRNFYLLRDFKYSNDTFEGFEETGTESNVVTERKNFLSKLESSFLSFPFVNKHFENPELSWKAAATPNNDGSQLIINNLEPAANNYVKTINYTNQLSDLQQKLSSRLSKYFHSDDLQEKRISAIKKSNELQLEFNKIFGKNPILYSTLLNLIILDETAVYNYFHENVSNSRTVESFDEYTLFRSHYPDLKKENPKSKNLEILRQQLYLNSIDEVEIYLRDRGIDFDKLFPDTTITTSKKLVDGVFDLWKSQLTIENFKELEREGLTKNTFNDFIDVLTTTMEHLNLNEFLVDVVERKTNKIVYDREVEEFLASICTNYINDFVVNVGFNFMSDNKIEEFKKIANDFKINFNELTQDSSTTNKEELAFIFEDKSSDIDYAPMIARYNKFILKLKLALLGNCGFVNYDVVENNRLSTIINKVNELDFAIESNP